MSDRYDSLACEAAAHERANAAEAEVERLRGLLTEAKAPRHEHEWAYTSETSVRVHWDGRKWCARYEPHNYVMVHRDVLVAELARLAGLTVPEGEG